MAVDRMARGREGPDEVLVVHLAPDDLGTAVGLHRETALADRTRLPGNERRKRAGALRGARLARGSPPIPPEPRPPFRFCRRAAAFFPLKELQAEQNCERLKYPKVTDPAVPPLRPERHNRTSLATVRVRLIAALVLRLPRCPLCHSGRVRGKSGNG